MYCKNNPIVNYDPEGMFSWLVIGIIAAATVIGGVAGYMSEDKLGPPLPEPDEITKPKPLLPQRNDQKPQLNPYESEPESTELSSADRFQNTIIGAGLGLLAGGAIASGVGAVGAVIVGGPAVQIGLFGATGAQTWALGAAIYNTAAVLINAFFGLALETIELP